MVDTEEIDLRPVLEHYGSSLPARLEPGGWWLTINCINPKHDDNNASARTNGLGYKCHACGLSGDAISLIKKIEGVTFDCAIGRLESLLGEEFQAVSQPTKRRRKSVSDRERNNARDRKAVSPRVRRRPSAGS